MANSHAWTETSTVQSPTPTQDQSINASPITGKSSHATHPTSPYVSVSGAPRQHADVRGAAALGVAPSQFFASI